MSSGINLSIDESVFETDASLSEITVDEYTRIGRVSPPDPDLEATIESLRGELLFETPRHPAAAFDDNDAVQACMNAAAEYFHQKLPEEIEAWIGDKWGIDSETIRTRKIGFVNESGQSETLPQTDLVAHLRDVGFSTATILRTGLVKAYPISHLFGYGDCTGVAPENRNRVPQARREAEVGDCSCSVPPVIDVLVRAQLEGIITPDEINLQAVIERLDKEHDLTLYTWWDRRITFPYYTADGSDVAYFIVRATDDTNDKIYHNGLIDRQSAPVTTLDETAFADHYPDWSSIDADAEVLREALEQYQVLSHRRHLFRSPDTDEYRTTAQDIVDLIDTQLTSDHGVSQATLAQHGLVADPHVATYGSQSPRVISIVSAEEYDRFDTDYIIDPPACGVAPGDDVEFRNYTDATVTLSAERVPTETIDWDETTIDDQTVFQTASTAGYYLYEITVGSETHSGVVAAYDHLKQGQRIETIENWVADEPTFTVDVAKYMKQTVNREWINTEIVHEPIYGQDTISPGAPLISTEGITDAIVAHQHNLPCITPATVQYKDQHKDHLTDIAEQSTGVIVINDNEENNAGIHGALTDARMIESVVDSPVYIAVLPRADSQRKVDLAEYLKRTDRETFIEQVLRNKDRVYRPTEHPLYDPALHDPVEKNSSEAPSEEPSSDHTSQSDHSSSSSPSRPDFDDKPEHVSGVYYLRMKDVLPLGQLGVSGGHGEVYRGEHPLGDYGTSSNFFAIYADEDDDGTTVYRAHDYKAKYTFTNNGLNDALTWLACAVPDDSTRSHKNPDHGPLTPTEMFYVWEYAKQNGYVPDDDPVPQRALYHIVDTHGLGDDTEIPSVESDEKLPTDVYNDALDVIDKQYPVSSGRR